MSLVAASHAASKIRDVPFPAETRRFLSATTRKPDYIALLCGSESVLTWPFGPAIEAVPSTGLNPFGERLFTLGRWRCQPEESWAAH